MAAKVEYTFTCEMEGCDNVLVETFSTGPAWMDHGQHVPRISMDDYKGWMLVAGRLVCPRHSVFVDNYEAKVCNDFAAPCRIFEKRGQ